MSYAEGVEAFRITDHLSDAERSALMGGSAQRIYGFAPRTLTWRIRDPLNRMVNISGRPHRAPPGRPAVPVAWATGRDKPVPYDGQNIA